MPTVWDAMRLNLENESVVVIPSVTLDRVTERSGSHDPGIRGALPVPPAAVARAPLRMVYVTSMPIAPAIVEYYLALLPGVIPSHARARL